MDRTEKLLLSADAAYGHGFKQGLFVRVYEQSLFWFVTHIKPLKPMLERVRGGEPVIYGGLPVASFEKLLAEKQLITTATENGWKWFYVEQVQGNDEDFGGYATWRESWRAAKQIPEKRPAAKRNILYEVRAFNLAGSTPIQAMGAIADWQEYLRNRSPACAEE